MSFYKALKTARLHTALPLTRNALGRVACHRIPSNCTTARGIFLAPANSIRRVEHQSLVVACVSWMMNSSAHFKFLIFRKTINLPPRSYPSEHRSQIESLFESPLRPPQPPASVRGEARGANDCPFRRNYTSNQCSFSESNSAIESFEQDNGSADGDSDTEKCPNQKIFGETHGLEFRIARNRFCGKNEADGGGRL